MIVLFSAKVRRVFPKGTRKALSAQLHNGPSYPRRRVSSHRRRLFKPRHPEVRATRCFRIADFGEPRRMVFGAVILRGSQVLAPPAMNASAFTRG